MNGTLSESMFSDFRPSYNLEPNLSLSFYRQQTNYLRPYDIKKRQIDSINSLIVYLLVNPLITELLSHNQMELSD